MRAFGTFFVVLSLLLAGCELSGSSSSSSSTVEVECQVKSRSQVALAEGDIGYYGCGPYRIVVTESTDLIKTRGSCSGEERVTFNDISAGDTLFVGYRVSDADYASSPTVIRPVYIQAYAPSCISGGYVDDTCGGCPDPFFD